jgi:hypothetical protein
MLILQGDLLDLCGHSYLWCNDADKLEREIRKLSR